MSYKDPIKVVYNASFGGFSLSVQAAMWLAERGNNEATEFLAGSVDDSDMFSLPFYCWELPRHSRLLIECVETLGSDTASGKFSELKIAALKGDRYKIEEYDGSESIVEPEDIEWIVVTGDDK